MCSHFSTYFHIPKKDTSINENVNIMAPSKIIVFEPVPLLREIFCQILSESFPDSFKVLNTTTAFLPDLQECQEDILIFDITMPGSDIFLQKCIDQYRLPGKKKWIVILNQPEIRMIKGYVEAGLNGILELNVEKEELLEAIKTIREGGIFFSRGIRANFENLLLNFRDKKKSDGITEREKKVLQLIVEENTTHEIARKLFISKATVETHRIKIMQKLKVKNTAGIVREAFFQQVLSGQAFEHHGRAGLEVDAVG